MHAVEAGAQNLHRPFGQFRSALEIGPLRPTTLQIRFSFLVSCGPFVTLNLLPSVWAISQIAAEAPSISSIAQLGNRKRTWVAVKTAKDYEYYFSKLDLRWSHL